MITKKQYARDSRAEVECTLYAVNMPLSFQSIRSLFEWLCDLPVFEVLIISDQETYRRIPDPCRHFSFALSDPVHSIVVDGPLKPHLG